MKDGLGTTGIFVGSGLRDSAWGFSADVSGCMDERKEGELDLGNSSTSRGTYICYLWKLGLKENNDAPRPIQPD